MANFGAARRFWEALTAPSAELGDIVDRERARLLSAFLTVLLGLGLISGVIQLLAVDEFLRTFVAMGTALAGIVIAYGLSRTVRYRAAAALAACLIIAACVAIRIANPGDQVWYAFMMIAVILASTFLPLRGAIAVAAFAFIAVAVAGLRTDRSAASWLPPLMFHAVFSPLLLVLSQQRVVAEGKRNRAERERERELLENRHLESIGRMASGIAHDFTNLLTVILGNSRLLLDRRSFDEISVRDIRDSAERGTLFIQQLLAFARKKQIQPEILDLNQVLLDMQPVLNRVVGDRIELQIDRGPRLPNVKADPVQLERALLNLVVNARDAMPQGGKLEIATVSQPQAAAGSPVDGHDVVVLRVRDTGGGMDETTRASISSCSSRPRRTRVGPGSASQSCTVSSYRAAAASTSRARSAAAPRSRFSCRAPARPDRASSRAAFQRAFHHCQNRRRDSRREPLTSRAGTRAAGARATRAPESGRRIRRARAYRRAARRSYRTRASAPPRRMTSSMTSPVPSHAAKITALAIKR